MVDHKSIQKKIDAGRGKGAIRVGQPYNVYRVQTNAALNFTDSINQVAASFPVFKRHMVDAKPLESSNKQGTFWYELVGNFTNFLVGDLFIQNDPGWGPGETVVTFGTVEFNGFVLTYHGPVKKAVGARCDRYAQVYRLQTSPNSTGYWENSINNAQPVILTNGVYSLGTTAQTATQIPIGLMPHDRTYGNDLVKDLPQSPKHTAWNCYVPPLNGFRFKEGDRIVANDGAQYVVLHPYRQEVGNVGSQLILQREVAQNI